MKNMHVGISFMVTRFI